MSTPPEWIAELTDRVVDRITPIDPLSPVGCHYHEEAGTWEITLFVSRTEVFGGEFDGQAFSSRYQMDLLGLGESFDTIEEIYWQPLQVSEDDQIGPHIGVVGTYREHKVWLRVAAEQPESLPSGRVADVTAMEFRDRW